MRNSPHIQYPDWTVKWGQVDRADTGQVVKYRSWGLEPSDEVWFETQEGGDPLKAIDRGVTWLYLHVRRIFLKTL